MKNLVTLLFTGLILSSVFVYPQSSKIHQEKMFIAPISIQNAAEQTTFYQDFTNRQYKINHTQKATLDGPIPLMSGGWDWPANQFTPSKSLAGDFFGDGNWYPAFVETGNTLLNAQGSSERYGVFSYMDNSGVTSYPVYGFDTLGHPLRSGWNGHLIMGNEAGIIYVALVCSLETIKNNLLLIDMVNDPNSPILLTDPSAFLDAGWERIALDGNGLFWMLQNIYTGPALGINVSSDGGGTFMLVDSVGSTDISFWGSEFANDPLIVASGNKISTVNKVSRGGSLARLGINPQGTSNPDSASGIYHWFSEDGGTTWHGEWILLEGDTVISNRPNYEPAFISYSTGSYVVDQNGTTHLVFGVGPNTGGIVDSNNINVYPVLYWNDLYKEWIALELTDVETYNYNFSLMNWGNLPAARPFVQADESSDIIVAMWNRPQFIGTPGATSINVYNAAGQTSYYHFDIVYSFSADGGITWSEPAYAVREPGKSFVYPVIAGIEVSPGESILDVTVHFTYLLDNIPGSFVVGQNPKSADNIYYYDKLTFQTLTNIVIDDLDPRHNNFRLDQNYPNPFNPSTSIQYAVSSRQFIKLTVYDLLGREVETLVNEEKTAGTYELTWNAAALPSGVYFYQLRAGNFVETKKMILLK